MGHDEDPLMVPQKGTWLLLTLGGFIAICLATSISLSNAVTKYKLKRRRDEKRMDP